MRALRGKEWLRSVDLRPNWPKGRDVWKDRRTDIWKFPLCSTGHRPFGAAAQKVILSYYYFILFKPKNTITGLYREENQMY